MRDRVSTLRTTRDCRVFGSNLSSTPRVEAGIRCEWERGGGKVGERVCEKAIERVCYEGR